MADFVIFGNGRHGHPELRGICCDRRMKVMVCLYPCLENMGFANKYTLTCT